MTLRKQISEILEKNPEVGGNMLSLTIAVWEEFYEDCLGANEATGETLIELNNLSKVPNIESISRQYRRIRQQSLKRISSELSEFQERRSVSVN